VVVSPTSVEDLAVLGPGHGCARKDLLLVVTLVLLHGGGSNLLLDEFGLRQVEDLDAGLGGDNEPVELLREENSVDWRVTVLLGEPLSVDNIPNHDKTITRA